MQSLEALPTELLYIIFSTFCYHCINTLDASTHAPSIYNPRENLATLCLVSKRLRDVAQPVLFHCFYVSGLDSLKRSGLRFVRTIFTRPDLARSIRFMTFDTITSLDLMFWERLSMQAAFNDQASRLDIPALSWPVISDQILLRPNQYYPVFEFIYEVIFRTAPNIERLTITNATEEYSTPCSELGQPPRADLLPSLKSLSFKLNVLVQGLCHNFLWDQLSIQNLTSLQIYQYTDGSTLMYLVRHAKNLEFVDIGIVLTLNQIAEALWECRHSLNSLTFSGYPPRLLNNQQSSPFSLHDFPTLRTVSAYLTGSTISFNDQMSTFLLESLPRSLVHFNFHDPSCEGSEVVLRCAVKHDIIQQGVLPSLQSIKLGNLPKETQPYQHKFAIRLIESGVNVIFHSNKYGY